MATVASEATYGMLKDPTGPKTSSRAPEEPERHMKDAWPNLWTRGVRLAKEVRASGKESRGGVPLVKSMVDRQRDTDAFDLFCHTMSDMYGWTASYWKGKFNEWTEEVYEFSTRRAYRRTR